MTTLKLKKLDRRYKSLSHGFFYVLEYDNSLHGKECYTLRTALRDVFFEHVQSICQSLGISTYHPDSLQLYIPARCWSSNNLEPIVEGWTSGSKNSPGKYLWYFKIDNVDDILSLVSMARLRSEVHFDIAFK
jgi:hypothetical protein